MPSKNASKQTKAKAPNGKAVAAKPRNGTRKSHLVNNASCKHTKIVVKCNCGFPNNLYIRGEGIKGLSWDRGALMQCTKDDEWVWETDAPFAKGQIKVLLNDRQFEQGENHKIACGKSQKFQPIF